MIRKILFGAIFLLIVSEISYAYEKNTQEGIINCNRKVGENLVVGYGEYIHRLEHDRSVVYNALNLSDEQIQIYEDMIASQIPCYEEKFNQLVQENYKLRAMQIAKSNEYDIIKQQMVVNKIRKELEKTFDKDTKSFKKCLTSDQRAKYSMIKKLQHDDVKKASHKKDYFKSNPQMNRFGNPEWCED